MAAREQVRGRGTKGRAWIGLPGNVFLTVAIPLDRVPVPLSLIPLRVGTLIAPGDDDGGRFILFGCFANGRVSWGEASSSDG